MVKVRHEPIDDEHMTVLTSTSTAVPTYGGTGSTLLGDDERNGRVNPALEVNDDEIDLTEMKRRKARRTSSQTTRSNVPQGQTSL